MLILIVVLYFAALVAIGVYLSKRVKQTSDFLLAGRKLGLPLIVATFAANQLGAGVILGGSELGAESGLWPGTWYGIGSGSGLIFAGLFVASRLRHRQGFVPLDFFAGRYGERKWIRIWGWLSNIPSLLGIFIAQIMGAGTIFTIFGLSYTQGIVISGLVIMLYSVLAGMWGVAVTNLVQLAIIMVSIPLVSGVVLSNITASGSASLGGLISTPFIPGGLFSKAVFIIFSFFLAISMSYDSYMRYQSSKSARVAQWGAILGGVIVITLSLCVGFIGAAGKKIFPSVSNAEIFPHMIKTMLPPALAGIVVAALLAAVMSTATCFLISLSGSFSRDFYNKVLHPSENLDELKHSKLISRLVVVGSVIAGVLIASQAKGILYTMIIFSYPYMGSMLIPLLGGLLWPRATSKGAIAAIFAGGSVGIVAFLFGVPGPLFGMMNIDLGLFIAYAVSTLVFVVVSLCTSGSGTHPDLKAAST